MKGTIKTATRLVLIDHRGQGNKSTAEPLALEMMRQTSKIRQNTPNEQKVVLLYDTRKLESADQRYAALFGTESKKLGNDHYIYIVLAPNRWFRILTRMAAKIADVDVTLTRTLEETNAYLSNLEPSLDYVLT